MTAGHRHRTVRVRHGSRIEHLLRTPLVVHRNREAAEQSRWAWGERIVPARQGDLGGTEYVLTPLGILHTLIGLSLCVYDAERPNDHADCGVDRSPYP